MGIFNKFKGLKPGRSIFNLSHTKLFNCYHGQLIPVLCEEMVPGDLFKIGNEMILRLQPMVAPILHEVNVFVHFFFTPYRILWPEPDGWETFITGGKTGDEAPSIPRWSPTDNALYSLWDYLGFPIGVVPTGATPLDFPRRAYNFIFNEYYRSQDLTAEVAWTNESILNRGWERDYFTSALPFQQRGTAPALPLSGSATYEDSVIGSSSSSANILVASAQVDNQLKINPENATMRTNLLGALNANTITTATYDVADLRLVVQIQKFLERNARAGARYKEFLLSHFGIDIKDARIQRPEFIGGTRSPIIVSEVLQTSGTPGTESTYTDTPQGTMAGHGITADSQRVSKYFAREFGVLMGILSIMPRTAYSQGIDRQWLRETKYDYYFPEFAHLSEQPVTMAELYANSSETNNKLIFGYQGRYNELRFRPSRTMGDMRAGQNLGYWSLSREFSQPPSLNQQFIECVGNTPSQMRVFAVQGEPPYIVHYGNRIQAIRPLPSEASPGLMDHF